MTTDGTARFRVLIADDEERILDAYKTVLQSERDEATLNELEAELFDTPAAPEAQGDFDLVFCRQGEQAVEVAQQAYSEGRPFSVAFLDVRMPPGLTGLEAAKRIREVDPNLNIVFVTGFSDVAPQQMSTEVPPQDRLFYLAKPFQPGEIQQLAAALANKWGVEQQLREAHLELKAQHAALQERERDLSLQNVRFDAALTNMSQGLCMFDAEQRLTVYNSRFLQLYGLSAEAVTPGMSLQELLKQAAASGLYATEAAPEIERQRLEITGSQTREFVQEKLADGRTIAISHESMVSGGWVETFEDITERLRYEARIQYLAHHDALTDLPNRSLFRDRLQQALAQVRRDRDVLAVLCLDLDRFKPVNDTLGHHIGDKLLEEVAQRLRGCVRDTDTVARLGGDEFAILQTGLEDPSSAGVLAKRVVEVLTEPYRINGHHIVTGASIGVAVAPNDGNDPDCLLKNADLALYLAKSDGRGIFRFFEPGLDARAQERRIIEVDLRAALSRGELELYYQPLINLKDMKTTGFEALVRWNHPLRGLVSPDKFIPVAEETGLIIQLGEQVLRQACMDASIWPSHIKVAVNLSPTQFKHRDLAQLVVDALDASGLSPERLELEITESVLMSDSGLVLETFDRIRRLGVHISMDDFGTGYSSLSYLRQFPFDKIKIDGSFVRDLEKNGDAAAIVRAIIQLGASLGMRITAEGVETAAQVEYLLAEGCSEAQGYYISCPQPVDQIDNMIFAAAGLNMAQQGKDAA